MKAPLFSSYAKTPAAVADTMREVTGLAEHQERERQANHEASKCHICRGHGELYEEWPTSSGGTGGGYLPCWRCNGNGHL